MFQWQWISLVVFYLKVKKFEVDEDTFYFYHSLCQQVEKIFNKLFGFQVQTGSGSRRSQHDGCEEVFSRDPTTTSSSRGDERIKTENPEKRYEGEGNR